MRLNNGSMKGGFFCNVFHYYENLKPDNWEYLKGRKSHHYTKKKITNDFSFYRAGAFSKFLLD